MLDCNEMNGGLEHFFFHSVGNVIIPTDFNSIIFQRGRYTTKEGLIISFYPNKNGVYYHSYIFRHEQPLAFSPRIFDEWPSYTYIYIYNHIYNHIYSAYIYI